MRITLALLGDSIAFGQGAASTGDTIGARVARALSDDDVITELHVLAVPRARSDQLGIQAAQALSESAQVAVIIVGANDLTHFVPPEQAAAHLGAAVRRLVGAGVQVVVAPAPDLSVVPWIPPQFQLLVASASKALREAQTTQTLAAGAHVANLDVASTRFRAEPALFSADRFHPSSAGYAVIADALLPEIRAAIERLRMQ